MNRRSLLRALGLTGLLGLFGWKGTANAFSETRKGKRKSTRIIEGVRLLHNSKDYCKDVYRKTPEGLEYAKWEETKPGDDVILFEWEKGKIVRIITLHVFDIASDGGLILSRSDNLVKIDGTTLTRTNLVEIDCVEPKRSQTDDND